MTIRLILSTLVLLSFSCSKQENVIFKLPSIQDIDEITTVILFHDSLPIYKKTNILDTTITENGKTIIIYPIVVPICIELRKIKVSSPDTSNIPPPPPPPAFDELRFETLYNIEIGGEKLFNSKDSIFFFTQNDTLFNFQLPTKFHETLQVTSIKEQKIKNSKQKYSANFYDISLPIFSADLKTAYVEIRHICNMCGGSSAYILQKVNGHWKVTNSFGLWIS